MTSSLRRRTRLRQVALLVAFLYFTFVGGTFITEQRLYPRIFHHVMVTLLLAGWLLYLLSKRQPFPVSKADLSYLLFFLAASLATAFAMDIRVSVEHLWTIFTHALFFYLVLWLMRQTNPRHVLEAMFMTASVVCLVGLAEWISWYTGLPLIPIFEQGWLPIYGLARPIPPTIYRLTVPLNIATWLAAYLALLIPVAVTWSISSRRKTTKQALWLWLPAAIFVLYFTYSRGGYLSLAVSSSVLGLLVFFKDEASRARLVTLLKDWRLWLVLLVVVLSGVFLVAQLFDRVGAQAGDSVRFDLWRTGWLVGAQNPIFGVGPYGYGAAIRPLRDSLITRDHLTSPHNILLLRWAELGIVGVTTYLMLIASVVRAGMVRWRQAAGPEQLRIAGILAALAGFSAQSQFDTFAAAPILIPVFVLVAYLLLPENPSVSKWHRWVPIPLLVLIIISGIGWSISDRAQWFYTRSMNAAASLEQRLVDVETAIQIDPLMRLYQVQRAQLLAQQFDDGDTGSLQAASLAFEELVASGVDNDVLLANYAALLVEQGDYETALAQVALAADRNPSDITYTYAMARILEESGETSRATGHYLTALGEFPALAVSAYWQQTTVRQTAKDIFSIENSEAIDTLETHDTLPPQCVGRADTTYIERVCLLYRVWQADDNIQADVIELIALEPSQSLAYELLALVALSEGNIEQAEQAAETLLFLRDARGHYILGTIAEREGHTEAALEHYLMAGPVPFQLTGWSIAVYNRPAQFSRLSFLDAPSLTGYDVLPWTQAQAIYEDQGRQTDSNVLTDFVNSIDPFLEF